MYRLDSTHNPKYYVNLEWTNKTRKIKTTHQGNRGANDHPACFACPPEVGVLISKHHLKVVNQAVYTCNGNNQFKTITCERTNLHRQDVF